MKKLLSCFFIISVNFLHAQVSPVAPQLQNQRYGFKSKLSVPTVLATNTAVYTDGIKNLSKSSQLIKDNMPVLGIGQVSVTSAGNNGHGFEVYKATPDNMPVVKPDATFYSTMPVVGKIGVNTIMSKP